MTAHLGHSAVERRQPKDLKPDEYRKVWRIAKRRFDFAADTPKDVWSRRLDLRAFDGTLFMSGNVKWLGVDGWNFHALNAENSNTVFDTPRRAAWSSSWPGGSTWLERMHRLAT